MTIKDLILFFQDISLKHKDVKEFQIGSWYDSAANTSIQYPLVFLEMPFTIDYDLNFQKDTIQFSLSVFLKTNTDSIKDDYEAISFCKSIGDAIISRVRLEATQFKVLGFNAISVREYSDDNVAGLRYDLRILSTRDICDNDIYDYFNE